MYCFIIITFFAAVTFFAFGKRFDTLNLSGAPPESQEYITTVGRVFVSLTELLFSLPLYKIFPTRKWRNVIRDQTSLRVQSAKFIDEKLAEIAEDDRRALEAVSGEGRRPLTKWTSLLTSSTWGR